MVDGDANDGAEVLVTALGADIAGIDAVLRQCLGRLGELDQQLVAVVVEVTDERHADAEVVELAADDRHGLRGGIVVDGDTNELGTRVGQCRHLQRGGIRVGRIGIGHRLDHHGLARSDGDASHVHAHAPPAAGPLGEGHDVIRPMSEMVTQTRNAISTSQPVK